MAALVAKAHRQAAAAVAAMAALAAQVGRMAAAQAVAAMAAMVELQAAMAAAAVVVSFVMVEIATAGAAAQAVALQGAAAALDRKAAMVASSFFTLRRTDTWTTKSIKTVLW